MPGDAIRHIAWTITAKMQTPYIKIFKEERELNVVLAVMLNGSMHFGSVQFKQDVVAELVALLGFSVIKNGDILSTYIFTDQMVSHSKPTKKMSFVQKSVSEILEFSALNKKADYKLMADTLYKRLKRKSLIVLIGDFFEDIDYKVLAKKHEVIALVVRDKLEEKPPAIGFSAIVDPETGAVLDSEFNHQSVLRYAKTIAQHDKKLFESFRKSGIKFSKIYTDDVFSVSLRRVFQEH
jgi:uncharacterized protein (DUF58 family)